MVDEHQHYVEANSGNPRANPAQGQNKDGQREAIGRVVFAGSLDALKEKYNKLVRRGKLELAENLQKAIDALLK